VERVGAAAGAAGYRPAMDISPAWLIVAVLVAAFIVGGLVWAFVADRRRNERVAHDTERFEQPAAPADADPDRWRRT
jgi:peptidoglycan/LPS O-acetylase OafA/YrhL